MLRLALDMQAVAFAGLIWTMLVSASWRGVEVDTLAVLGWIMASGIGALVIAAFRHPDASGHYLLYATPSGMASQSLVAVATYALLALWVVRSLGWLLEYRQLRATTPEERVLGEE